MADKLTGFGEIVNAPVDGVTYLLHMSGTKAVIYRVSASGSLSMMWCGDAVEAFREILSRSYPAADVFLNETDLVGERTKYKFETWADFCESFNSEALSRKKIIAEHVRCSTNQTAGMVELVDGKLVVTERGKAADMQEVALEEEKQEGL